MGKARATPKWKYGYKPDLVDPRDHTMSFSAAALAAAPPVQARFATGLPSIWNQSTIGSCTAHGILRAFMFAAAKAGILMPMLSRLMLYFQERDMEGTTSSDAGAQIRDGIKALVAAGCCEEGIWPYDVSKFASRPPQAAYDDAKKHVLVKYARVTPTPDQIMAVHAAGFPVVFGFTVWPELESALAAKTGRVNRPKPGEPILGGHCVCSNGRHDANQQTIGFDQSWGVWGLDGTGDMDFWYFVNGAVSDAWVLYTVQNAGDLPTPTPGPDPKPKPAGDVLSIVAQYNGKMFTGDLTAKG